MLAGVSSSYTSLVAPPTPLIYPSYLPRPSLGCHAMQGWALRVQHVDLGGTSATCPEHTGAEMSQEKTFNSELPGPWEVGTVAFHPYRLRTIPRPPGSRQTPLLPSFEATFPGQYLSAQEMWKSEFGLLR